LKLLFPPVDVAAVLVELFAETFCNYWLFWFVAEIIFWSVFFCDDYGGLVGQLQELFFESCLLFDAFI
jgi:hypothetical protein